MKNCWHLAISTLFVMACWTTIAGAETRYISDQLVVSLRDQPQRGTQAITHLKTDMAVEILEEAGDYIKVQTKAGEIGYIKQNYLTPKTPKTKVIEQLKRDRDRLASKVDTLQQQVDSATSKSKESQQGLATQLTESQKLVSVLQKQLKNSQETLAQIDHDYQTLQKNAKGVIAITRERDQLRKTNLELTTAVANLEEEIDSLVMFAVLKWFFAGAGVLLLGWIIGKSSSRRRSRF